MYIIGFLVRADNSIASISDAESLVLIDLDDMSEKKIRLRAPHNLNTLTQFIEDNDMAILFVSSINDEEQLLLEETGVKIYVVGDEPVEAVLSEVIG